MAQRGTTLLNDLLGLEGVRVAGCELDRTAMTLWVDVKLRRQALECPWCGWSTKARYDTRNVRSVWRHVDFGFWKVMIRCRLRRLNCPECGVLTEGVPFARPVSRSRFTYIFEHMVCWAARNMDKTAVQKLLRIGWATVGAVIRRVVDDQLDDSRYEDLFLLSVDEISWRKHHRYLTIVVNAESGEVIWGAPGKDAATLDRFFDAVGEDTETIQAVSMDMGPVFAKSVAEHTDAEICIDPFHVVKIVGDSLDEVRRRVWQEMRLIDETLAKRFKGMRWALLKNRQDLTDDQAGDLRRIRRKGGELWRAYTLKESLRDVFAGDLTVEEAIVLLRRWCDKASRSRIPEMVRSAKTIRKQTQGIAAALTWGLNNGRHEGINTKIRLIMRRAYGFHTPQAALALVMLNCGPIEVVLPWEHDHANAT